MPNVHWTPRQSGFIHERQNLDQEIDETFPAIPMSNPLKSESQAGLVATVSGG